MASIPQHYYSSDNYMIFTNDQFCHDQLPNDPMLSVGTDRSGSDIQIEETLNPYFNNMVPFHDSDITSSMSMPLLPGHHLRVSDMNITALPDHDRAFFGGINNAVLAGYQHESACEFGEECSGLASNFWSAYPNMSSDNWEIQGRLEQKVEEPTLKITRYSAEEKKDRILRYLKKRSQRNFNKTIKYACRKTLADKRVRVRGRFAKNNVNELCSEDESTIRTDQTTCQEPIDLYFNNPLQFKAHDEEWLQEAISNLMYYHIFPDNTMELP